MTMTKMTSKFHIFVTSSDGRNDRRARFSSELRKESRRNRQRKNIGKNLYEKLLSSVNIYHQPQPVCELIRDFDDI